MIGVAPGVELVYDGIPGLRTEAAQARVPHAWKAGAQTVQLQRMLAAWLPGLHELRARHKGLLRWAVDVDPLAI